jgi:hypothetical protein
MSSPSRGFANLSFIISSSPNPVNKILSLLFSI